MSTFPKQLRLYAKSVKEHISNKLSSLDEFQPSLPDKASQDLFQYPSSNVVNVDTSTTSSYQRKFNPWTDSYSGLHEYE